MTTRGEIKAIRQSAIPRSGRKKVRWPVAWAAHYYSYMAARAGVTSIVLGPPSCHCRHQRRAVTPHLRAFLFPIYCTRPAALANQASARESSSITSAAARPSGIRLFLSRLPRAEGRRTFLDSRSPSSGKRSTMQRGRPLFRADPTARSLVESTLLHHRQSSQQQHGQQMPSQAHNAAASGLPASHSPQRRRRLSVDESMAAAGLFVLARQDVGDPRRNSTKGATGAAAAAAANIAPKLATNPKAGKINDGLQPPILTRDAILQHQAPMQSGAQEKLQSSPKKTALFSSSLPVPAKTFVGGNSGLTASALLHQQPHNSGVNNILHNQQLLAIIQKRRMEDMLRQASIGPYAALQPQSQSRPQPPAKRIKINPPSALSSSPGQWKAPKKCVLARKSEDHVLPPPSSAVPTCTTPKNLISRQLLSLAPEEEVDPLTGNLINTVQDYYPHDDDGGEGLSIPRARVFMSSHHGRAAATQSGYGTLPSWKLAKKRQLTEKSSPSIAKMRSKISALM